MPRPHSFIHGSAVAIAAVAIAACAPSPPPATAVAAAVGVETITAQAIYDRIYFLASDGLRGRDTPSPGLEAAAAYLVSEHRRAGVEPAGEEGFYQRYPFLLRALDADAVEFALSGHPDAPSFRYGHDFFLMGGIARPVTAGLVFAGDDIDAAGRHLSGRVAVVSAPGSWDRDFRIGAGQQARVAEEAGARAVIHVLDGSWTEEMVGRMAAFYGRPGWVLGEDVAFPQLFLTRDAANRMFTAADVDLEAVLRSGADPDFAPVPLPGMTGRFAAERAVAERSAPPNVIGVVRGRDPELRNEYVVLSAHFDHVGVGEPMNRDSIYNGADDNASGTAALLEIGRVLASLPEAERPRRSVLLVHVSGEEKGLLGSRWYADNPTVPIESMVANINVDMIAGDEHRDSVVVIGKDYSDLGALVDEVNARHADLGLIASDDIWPEQRFFFRSDHFNFARREVPAIFFFTGVHECYHRPCDTPDFIDADKGARVTRLVYHTTMEIANRDARPEWDPEGLEEVRALTR